MQGLGQNQVLRGAECSEGEAAAPGGLGEAMKRLLIGEIPIRGFWSQQTDCNCRADAAVDLRSNPHPHGRQEGACWKSSSLSTRVRGRARLLNPALAGLSSRGREKCRQNERRSS